jgi:tetrahydromethanopterin S-methyltransferase subunit G
LICPTNREQKIKKDIGLIYWIIICIFAARIILY